jgi:hypothetical protein
MVVVLGSGDLQAEERGNSESQNGGCAAHGISMTPMWRTGKPVR